MEEDSRIKSPEIGITLFAGIFIEEFAEKQSSLPAPEEEGYNFSREKSFMLSKRSHNSGKDSASPRLTGKMESPGKRRKRVEFFWEAGDAVLRSRPDPPASFLMIPSKEHVHPFMIFSTNSVSRNSCGRRRTSLRDPDLGRAGRDSFAVCNLVSGSFPCPEIYSRTSS